MSTPRPDIAISAVLAAAILAVSWVACDWPAANADASHGNAPADPQQTAPPPDDRVAQSANPNDFSVHEWGLVRFTSAGVELATSGYGLRPAVPRMDWNDITVEKPILYLHPGPTFDPNTVISLGVTVVGGSIREVWPTPGRGVQPANGASAYTWSDIRLRVGQACGGDRAPTLADPPCTSLTDGGVCEGAEVREYLRPVGDCLTVGGVETPVLVYNGYAQPQPVPVVVTSGVVTNTTGYPVGPAWVRDGGQIVRIDHIDPAGSVSATMGTPVGTTLDATTLLADLRAALVTAGLTDDEAGDFIDAWRSDVLAAPIAWTVLGFFASAAVDAVYPLQITPTPTSVARVLLFESE